MYADIAMLMSRQTTEVLRSVALRERGVVLANTKTAICHKLGAEEAFSQCAQILGQHRISRHVVNPLGVETSARLLFGAVYAKC